MTTDNIIPDKNTDKAGEDYWTSVWQNTPLPPPFNVNAGGINGYPNKVFHQIFQEILEGKDWRGKKLLEIGCGNSVFLSYFATTYGFEIYGLDYSSFGCAQTIKILERDNLKGHVIEGDAFNPSPDLLNKFDVVCSFGVLEHFAKTADTLRAFSKFLNDDGILITSVPNLAGFSGSLHKWMNKPVFDIHIPMDKKYLDAAVKDAGLKPLLSRYFLSVNFGVNLESIDGKPLQNLFLKKLLLKTLRYGSKIIWMFENIFGSLPAGKMFSGGIITAARKS